MALIHVASRAPLMMIMITMMMIMTMHLINVSCISVILVHKEMYLVTGVYGHLKWTGDWVSYIDTMLQMSILSSPGRGLCLPTRIKSLVIDPAIHTEKVIDLDNDLKGNGVYM